MNVSIRFILVSPEGEVMRLSNARFRRLFDQSTTDALQVFSGKRIRAAEVIVELTDRRPVRVVRSVYYHFEFDANGVLDYNRYMEEGAVGMAALPDFGQAPSTRGSLIDASKTFALRRLTEVVRWRPEPELERLIHRAALDESVFKRI